jgi:hypothetical protein
MGDVFYFCSEQNPIVFFRCTKENSSVASTKKTNSIGRAEPRIYNNNKQGKHLKSLIAVTLAVVLTGCASAAYQPKFAAPSTIQAPQPIIGNSGKFMSPFTEDGTVAAWVEKGKSASAGSSVGGFVGAQAGQHLAKQIPFIGGMLGQSLGESAGRQIALNMVGGEEFIRANSDMSFNTVQELAVYMYAKNSSHKDYVEALKLTQEIYPELKTAYYPAIAAASR